MKKVYFILATLLATALTSCDVSSDRNEYPSSAALVTVHILNTQASQSEYSFKLDNGKSIYPGDKSRIPTYDTKDKDGKRAVIYFNLLETPAPGYDYNAQMHFIEDVLTKSVEKATTAEELEAFGDDRIHIENAWISGGWLNIYYAAPTDGTGVRKHRLSLVDYKATPPPTNTPEGYTLLEFRHDADGDTSGQMVTNYVCYKLDQYDPSTSDNKGIYLKLNPLAGSRYMKIEPRKTE